MKKIILTLALALSFSGLAEAKSASWSNQSVKNLIQRLENKFAGRKLKASSKLVNFWIAPEIVTTDSAVTIFAQNETGFSDSEILMEGSFDGQSNVALEHPAKELWIYEAGPFTEQRNYTFTAKVFIRDANEAKQIQDAISSLEADIFSLNEQIANTLDPELIAELTAIRDEKIALKDDLVEALTNLKTEIGQETFTFAVGEGTAPSQPKITSVTPDYGTVGGGTTISIHGQNFGANPTVKVGEFNAASIISASSEVIQIVTPGFPSIGPKDLEVRFTEAGKIKNAVRKNGYWATFVNENPPEIAAPPVAASGAPQTIALGATATFSGSGSYDPNPSSAFRYEWKIISKPLESAIEIPTNPPGNSVEFQVTGDVPGTYVLSLQVFETNGPLSSEPSLTVLNVTAPANRAPVANAANISIGINGTTTRQISVSDLDTWQNHTFHLAKQSSLGTASVSSTGLVTYVAGPNEGEDFIGVLVVDNGSPSLSSLVNIQVNQLANLPPVVGEILAPIVSRGVPYNVVLITDSAISDPDNQIASVRWDFGDGTSERSMNLQTGFIFHDYVQTGSYNVSVTVTDSLGGQTVKTKTISVVDTDIPTAKIKGNTFVGTAPLTINFDASESSDSDGIIEYRWNWSQGPVNTDEVTTSPTISHTFTEPGHYQVNLATLDEHGAAGTNYVHVFVDWAEPLPPVHPSIGDFRVSPGRRVILGDPLAFDGTRSYNPNIGFDVTNYSWNFSDGQTCPGGCTATGATTNYTYLSPGLYYPMLNVTGPDGLDFFPGGQEVQVVNTGFLPKALFYGDVSQGPAPLTVNFVNESYAYGSATLVSAEVHYNDPNCTQGCISSGPEFSYTYTQPDTTYFPMVVVTDSDGNQSRSYFMVETDAVGKAKKTQKVQKKKLVGGAMSNPKRENDRRIFTNLCGMNRADACYFLANMYEEDGNESLAAKLKAKSCSLGFQPACSR